MKKIKVLTTLLATAVLASASMATVACSTPANDYVFEAEDALLVQSALAPESKPLTVENSFEWCEGYNQDDPDTPIGPEVTAVANTEFIGTQIIFNIKAADDCDAVLKFRAASRNQAFDWDNWGWGEMLATDMASEDKSYKLTVNNVEVAMTGVLPGTENCNGYWAASYAHYGEVTANIKLVKGENKIVFEVVKFGGNVDKITISAPCTLTMEKTDNTDRVTTM